MSRILLFFLLLLACNDNLQPAVPVDDVKALLLSEVKDLNKTDTLYVIITPYTAQSVNVMQAAEYPYAATMLKRQKSADTLYYQLTANTIINNTDKLDGTKVIYYRLATMLTYYSTDKVLNVAEKWLFMDEQNKLVDKYKIVTQVSQFDNNELRTYPFSQLTEDDIQTLRHSSSFLKF